MLFLIYNIHFKNNEKIIIFFLDKYINIFNDIYIYIY